MDRESGSLPSINRKELDVTGRFSLHAGKHTCVHSNDSIRMLDCLVAQKVKESAHKTGDLSLYLGQEDSLEKNGNHSVFLPWKNPMDGGARQATVL